MFVSLVLTVLCGIKMGSKNEFTIKQKAAFDAKWLRIELHEALNENCLSNYWNEMIEDSELIPMDSNLQRSRKGLTMFLTT